MPKKNPSKKSRHVASPEAQALLLKFLRRVLVLSRPHPLPHGWIMEIKALTPRRARVAEVTIFDEHGTTTLIFHHDLITYAIGPHSETGHELGNWDEGKKLLLKFVHARLGQTSKEIARSVHHLRRLAD